VPRYRLKLPLGHVFGNGELVDKGVEGDVPVAMGYPVGSAGNDALAG
jgi:hypothetical protein